MSSQLDLRTAARVGSLAGVVTLSVSVVGMLESFDQRDLIVGMLTLGQLLLFSAPFIAGYLATRDENEIESGSAIMRGAIAGVLTAVPLIILILLTLAAPNIRNSLVNISPEMIGLLSLGASNKIVGSILLFVVMAVLGVAGAAVHIFPNSIGKPLAAGLGWMLGLAILSEVSLNILRPILGRSIMRAFFGSKGITPLLAAIIFVVAIGLNLWWNKNGRQRYETRKAALSEAQQKQSRRLTLIAGIVLLLTLPLILGTYLTEVVDNVGLFILMGLGLNIVVGYAGLLDLGYVAFFAIGAYVMGILTSQGALGIGHLSFWLALPIAVGTAVLFGVTLGMPVLRMRGDYLAIVTLGFGEIIRVLATSDLLKPYIGGAQGVLQIGKPTIFGFEMVKPIHFYYLILAGVALAAFVSSRLRDARLGRQWMALREDEDVAEAMGIHLVSTKLLAFGIGAAFSGLAGAIFSARLSSIFPHSFNLLISINVLSLIIVGGIGSLPGVVVGALVLVGLPELLREFAEYRMLLYGVLLIAMMIARPEGLWPSPIIRREFHADEEEVLGGVQ
jgi:branched-chain amino acid transport system permease protein